MFACSAWKVSGVSLKCFLFEIDDKTEECLPVLLGKFRVLTAEETDWTHRYGLHDIELVGGAEFLIADEDLALFEITETETSVIVIGKEKKTLDLDVLSIVLCLSFNFIQLEIIIKKKKDQRKVDITSDDPSNLPIQIRNRQFSSPFSKTQLMESVSCDFVLAGGNLFFGGGGKDFTPYS